MTAIGKKVLDGCVSLKELEYNAINYTDKIENIFGESESSVALDKLIIGEDVTVIPEGLLGSGLLVKELEYNSAIGCSLNPISAIFNSLEKILIGERVKKLPGFAFSECETLTTLVYNAENCESIGAATSGFETYPNLRNLTIGKDVKTIPANIFSGCSFLVVNVPDNVISIGESAFKDNTYLLNLSLGKSLKTISDNVFNNCYNIRSIDSKNTTPPVYGKGVFANVQTLASKLNVPTESVPLYQTAYAWIDFWNIIGKEFSGVEDAFMDDAEEPAEYYNLNGVKVENPEKGIYIKKQGGKTTKVV